jgi:hypothetical protein
MKRLFLLAPLAGSAVFAAPSAIATQTGGSGIFAVAKK